MLNHKDLPHEIFLSGFKESERSNKGTPQWRQFEFLFDEKRQGARGEAPEPKH
jgi:hypothetical protein